MTDQTHREIIKSYVYGLNIEEIATYYKLSQPTIRKIISSSEKEISDIKKHYKNMEGDK
jgi:Mor family transcriptional regulator